MKKTPNRHMPGKLLASCRKATAALVLVTALLAPLPEAVALDSNITKGIWRLKYGVSDAQLNDVNWQNADADGDGVKNISEAIAGTNPFVPGSVVKITNITVSGGNVSLTFPTVLYKQYVVQGSGSLTGFLDVTPVTAMGTDANVTLVTPMGGNKFFRVLVQDVDSDSDGASDWAEVTAGYNPNGQTTVGGAADADILSGGVSTSNVITVSVTKSNAVQPGDSSTPPVETGFDYHLAERPLRFTTITVPLEKYGTALEGTDYDGLPASIEFAKANSATQGGASEVVLKVNPKFNGSRKTNVTAIVKALAGTGYTLGSSVAGGVVITPTGIANGTGLTGRYYANASINYTSGNNFGVTTPSELLLTRTDPTIDFTSPYNATTNPTGWDTPAPTTRPISTISGVYSIRWTGQVMPQYSETYSFDFRSRDGGKLWVNGQLLIDNWTTQAASDRINTIALKAGVLYDIKAEYFSAGAAPEARLYWWSPSRPKQIIPVERLFPELGTASKPTAITSPLAAVGYEGTPFVFNVTAADISASTTFALDAASGPLPPGLTLSTAGAITGTPTLAGHFNVVVNATNTAASAVTGSSVIDITIFPTGGVTREMLTGSGSSVAELIIPTGTPTHDTIATLDDNTDYGPVNSGERLRGYLVPPKTGNYYFWLAASNAAELWISNDSQYVNKVLRASVTATTGYKTWNAQASQQSPWLSLVAEKYYFEVLHNRGSVSDDHVAVGWCQDDIGTVPAVAGAPNPNGILTSIANGGGPKQGYPYSGAVPGFVCQPYDYPPVTPPTGKLYACNMGPQGGVVTSASGSASLQMNAEETQAILHFSYQNLGTPRIAYHLHTDGFTGTDLISHNTGAIVFDIDDADAITAQQTGDGGYIWTFAPIGDFTSVAQIVEAIKTGKIYINVHSVTNPGGEIRGNFNLIEGSQTPPDPALYADPGATDVNTDYSNAARFLNQATFGASPADVAEVQSVGFNQWITNQLAKPNTRTSGDVVAGITADINSPYPSSLFTNTWWKNSITGQDQLRQRLAFALSEILVVSWANDSGPLQNNGRILADYYDQLVDYCLPTAGVTDSGNFRGILKAVTLTPAMGLYLDMRANQKGDVTIGRIPNENYAREIMQLFSIGIYRMWDDGRFVLGADAGLVPTYTQPSIIGLANLLTGWNYAQNSQANGRAPTSFGPGADYSNPMVLVPNYHELSSKLLLNRVISPEATGRTPRVNISGIAVGSPACTVTTATVHGLKTGDTIHISGVTGGTFTGGLGAINNSFQATVTSAKTFTVPVACSAAAGALGTVTGATVMQPAYPTPTSPLAIGVPPVSGSQADNSGTGTGHPFDQYGLKELDLAIDNIVNHENVAPYICRQLIQRLVTSDPSPGYVYRVVQKFKNNGSGVRGDLAAVVRQILTDGEARRSSVTQTSTTFGKQREPMLRLTGAARAFPSVSYTGTYTQLTGTSVNKFRLVTSTPNDFNSGSTVSLDFRSNYVNLPTGQTVDPYTNPTSTSYSIAATQAIASTYTDISSIGVSSPCLVNTVQPHGLVNGNTVIITGVTGGTFSAPITTARTVANVTANSFTLTGVNCTVAPTSVASAKMVSTPCRITTQQPHGLTTGDSVTITGVTGGTFSGAGINSSFTVTVVDATSFLPLNPTFGCTAAANVNTGAIVGANTLEVTATGMVLPTYTQTAGTNTMTVNISGPQTNINVPGTATSIKSKVYISVNSRTAALPITSISTGSPCTINKVNHGLVAGNTITISGVTGGTFNTPSSINGTFTVLASGLTANAFQVQCNCTVAPTAGTGTATGSFGPTAANGVYEVQSNGTNTFTVTTADTPTATRTGNVLIPRIQTSYTPGSDGGTGGGGKVVSFATNVNHNFNSTASTQIWVDAPVNTEFPWRTPNTPSPAGTVATTSVGANVVLGVSDEDHFKISYLPSNLNGGSYPTLSGGNNGIIIWPLVPAPTSRSGSVKINQSTFVLNSTESTLTQSPLNAPTVFNYFLPDYKFPGTLANNGLDSPEFQLSTDTNLTNLTNSMTNMFIATGGGNGNLNGLNSFNAGGGSVVMDIEPYMTKAKTENAAAMGSLADEIAALLVGAPLDPNVRTTIVNFVANNTNFPYTTPTPSNLQMRDRVRAIIHLIITSSSYAVQK